MKYSTFRSIRFLAALFLMAFMIGCPGGGQKQSTDKRFEVEPEYLDGRKVSRAPLPKPVVPPKGDQKNPIRVLHASLEYPGAKVGGVGTVAGELVKNQAKLGEVASKRGNQSSYIDASAITPWYDFIKTSSIPKPVVRVSHLFKGKAVESTIHSTFNNGAVQYLVKPADEFSKIFSIFNAANVYTFLEHSSLLDRIAYFNGALAAFGIAFKEKQGLNSFDLIHFHSWAIALAGPLMTEIYEQTEEPKKLPKTVYHLHSLFDVDFANFSREQAQILGLDRPNGLNGVVEGLKNSDAVISVSKWLENTALEDKRLEPWAKESTLVGVLNGIDYDAWDPKDLKTTLGGEKDFGFIPEEAIDGKAKVKSFLVSEGFLQDASRPIIMYVGRFSNEKGIQMLPGAVEHAINLGANIVIMGTFAGDGGAFKVIDDLRKKYESSKHVLVLPTIESQKNGNLGKLIRAAADFVLVPSFAEGAGLVPRESMVFGTMVISSGVQGLEEQLEDFTKVSDPRFEGNAFVYGNNEATRDKDLENAIKQALSFIKNLSDQDHEDIVRRLAIEARGFDWQAPDGPLEDILDVYKRVLSEPK